ncbi:MAG TPA: hypothetical protein VFB93_03520 [Burkholderiales bacterium]|nr:hypothetical protein [Burkholderiales bacterium]
MSKPGRYGIEGAFASSWLTPGYWKTLANLRAADPEVTLDGPVLRFARYPFEPASIFPGGTVAPAQISEVNLGYPCHVRLASGDILFVPSSGKAALVAFLNRHDIPVERRRSVWSALLDPFLDTWEEQESIDRQFDWFAALGLERDAVDRWRREVAVAMVAYNFGTRLWEWAHLDLYDALLAQRARLNRAAFADFYARAIRLAALDPVSPGWTPSGNTVASALFSVLLAWYPKKQQERSREIEGLKQTLAGELTAAYSAPHRRYHTVAHIEKCLDELAGAWSYAVALEEVRWALLFHDAVYDPRRQDNEARSADWACSVMDQLERPEDEQARIRAMIMGTAHAAEPRTPDEALLLDIDLAILGADEAQFDEYDRAVREEYAWVPEPEYRHGRAKVLESLLGRERVYHTAPYRRLELPARRNLERALARIQ